MEWFIISILCITNMITITIVEIEEREKRDLQEKFLEVLEKRIKEKN